MKSSSKNRLQAAAARAGLFLSSRRRPLAIAAALLSAIFILTAAFAGFFPERFFSNRAGRAVGSRLIQVSFVRSYLEKRPGILINPRTVRFGLRQAGVEDIEVFRERMREGRERLDWDSLSPSRKRSHFQRVYSAEHLRYTVPVIMSLPDEHREEVVEFVAGMIRTYRTDMNREEAVELHRHLNSPEGRRAISGAQRYFLTELSPEEFKAISPIVDEIVLTAVRMLE